MANILIGITGSVAAVRAPVLYHELRRLQHQVRLAATQSALYFFDPAELYTRSQEGTEKVLYLDEDEWPGRGAGRLYQRGDPVLHIELRRWADMFVIAPLDANTLAKLAAGLADNCLTCIWRAWDLQRPVILAPAMNTLMWENSLTIRHLRQLAADRGRNDAPSAGDWIELVDWINRNVTNLNIVPPQDKRLACGDVGMGAMAEVGDIVAATESLLRAGSDRSSIPSP